MSFLLLSCSDYKYKVHNIPVGSVIHYFFYVHANFILQETGTISPISFSPVVVPCSKHWAITWGSQVLNRFCNFEIFMLNLAKLHLLYNNKTFSFFVPLCLFVCIVFKDFQTKKSGKIIAEFINTSVKASIPASRSFQLESASCFKTASEMISTALASTSSG